MKFFLKVFVCVHVSFLFYSTVEAQEQQDWIWPTQGIISDTFGSRNGSHYGVDIAAPKGQRVVAVQKGNVTRSYYSHTYGHVVFVSHSNQYETVYAHLSRRFVAEGERVKQNETIGAVGNTGHSYGNHLHFEVHKKSWTFEKNNAINPLLVLEKTVSVASSSTKRTHVVTKGETLWGISLLYNTTVDKLMKKNHLKSEKIIVGQKLIW